MIKLGHDLVQGKVIRSKPTGQPLLWRSVIPLLSTNFLIPGNNAKIHPTLVWITFCIGNGLAAHQMLLCGYTKLKLEITLLTYNKNVHTNLHC